MYKNLIVIVINKELPMFFNLMSYLSPYILLLRTKKVISCQNCPRNEIK